MKILFNLLINGLGVFIAASILPGVHLANFMTAVIVAVVLGMVNMLVKPIILILTLPITILTLGFFTFVINALMVLLVSLFVSGFSVDHFGWALLFSIVLSFTNWFLRTLKY